MASTPRFQELNPGQSITLTIEETGEIIFGEVETFCPELQVVWIESHGFGSRRLVDLGEVSHLRLKPADAGDVGQQQQEHTFLGSL